MRLYNPAIGKFLSVDPIAKQYPHYSPYSFAGNKPIWAIDLDGLEEKFTTGVTAWPSIKDAKYYTYGLGGGNTAVKVAGNDSWTYRSQDSKGFTDTYEWKPGQESWTLIHSGKADYDAKNANIARLDNVFVLGTFGVPAAIMTGVPAAFAVEGLSWVGAGSGAADFTIQMAQNKGDINKWNITSTVSQTFMPNPFASAFTGSVAQVNLGDVKEAINKQKPLLILRSSVAGEKTGKDVTKETVIGGTFNWLSGKMFDGFKIDGKTPHVDEATLFGSYFSNSAGNTGSGMATQAVDKATEEPKK
jgi:hypothetical protein